MANLPELQRAVMRVPNGAGTYDTIEFDCVEKETHELTNTVTDHPVETGFNVSDHSRPEPRPVTLDVVQTNTPLVGANGSDRAGALWQRFVDLWQNPKLVALDLVGGFFASMAITKVSRVVEVKNAQALVFTVAFKEVRVVENKFARLKPTKDTRGQRRRDLGKETSAAARLWDGAGRLLSGAR